MNKKLTILGIFYWLITLILAIALKGMSLVSIFFLITFIYIVIAYIMFKKDIKKEYKKLETDLKESVKKAQKEFFRRK